MVDPPGLAGSGGVTGSGGVAWAGAAAAAGMNTRKRGRQSDTGSNPAEAMLKSGGQFLKNQPAASIPAGASLPVPRSSPPGKASGGTRSGAAFSGAAVEVKCDPGSQGGVTQGEPVDESEDLLQEDEDMDEMAIWRENVKIMKAAGVPLPPHMVLAPQPAKDGKQPLPPTARDLTAHLPPDQRDDAMARIRREKNRLAARKCRAKKIACMQETEARRSQLEEANADLRAQLAALQAKFAAEVQMREALKNVILKQWAEPCGPDGQDASMRLAGLLLPGLNTAADVISAIEAGELEVDELKREQGEGGKGLERGAGEEEEWGLGKEQGEGQGGSTTTYLASSLMLVRVGACDHAAQGQGAGMGRQLDHATGPSPLIATTTSTLTHRTASPGPGTATTPTANGGAPTGPSFPGAAVPNHISLKRATSSLFMASGRMDSLDQLLATLGMTPASSLAPAGMPTSEYHLYKRQGCQAARCASCVKSTPAANTGWVEVHVEGEAV
ncbi:hypothetical protein QJQ45_017894 [Haematococcus lacustris]|nr:hypothetical protein QJQ45_017894 [Haematococcus lacustris]